MSTTELSFAIAGLVIAVVGLAIAAYQACAVHNDRKSQNKINEIELEKATFEKAGLQKANFTADFSRTKGSNGILTLSNIGASSAKNVGIEFLSGKDMLAVNVVRDLFPVPSVEPTGKIRIPAFISLSAAPYITFKVVWDDAAQEDNEKELSVAI